MAMVVYDLESRKSICEQKIIDALDSHERHFFEQRLVYLENLTKKY